MTKFRVVTDALLGTATQVAAAMDADGGARATAPSSAEFGHPRLAGAATGFVDTWNVAIELHRDQAREVEERLKHSAELYELADATGADSADVVESAVPKVDGPG